MKHASARIGAGLRSVSSLTIYGTWTGKGSDSKSRFMSEAGLETLSWRYAALIGIVTAESAGMTDAEVTADRERWPHLLEKIDDVAVLDLNKGAAFIAEISGAPLAKCRRVLSQEWG